MRRGSMILALLAAAGCAPLAPPATNRAVELYAMDCGRIRISDADLYADDGSFKGQARELVDPCFLVRHPRGDLIWDTGLPDSADGVAGGTHSFVVRTGFVDQLARLDLTPADIEFLALSHAHFDHTGNAALFTRATWIVDADEHAWMFRDAARREDDFAQVAPLQRFSTRLIEGEGDYDVFGDGTVVIVQAPGHTPGHCVLLVRLRNAGPVLLAGDMWHMADSRERRIVPRFNTDREQTLRSMDKVEALAARLGARIVRQHVEEDFNALPAFPTPLD